MSEMKKLTPWISSSGTVALSEARGIAAAYAGDHANSRYLAFHTDHFSAGYAKDVSAELSSTLLEMRIFDTSSELYLRRSTLSADFQYRIADDGALAENIAALHSADAFLADPEHYRKVSLQVLDIDATYPSWISGEKNDHDCRLIRTVGGGYYALPLDGDDDVVRVVNYLCYDPDTGVGRAADFRVAGFEKWKGGVGA